MPWLLIRIAFRQTRTKVVSRKVLNGLNLKKNLFPKVIQSAGQLNTCFPYVRTFGPKIPKLLGNNIYQSMDARDEKRASLELKHHLDRHRPIWKAF